MFINYIGVSIIFKCVLAKDFEYLDDQTDEKYTLHRHELKKHTIEPKEMSLFNYNSVETDSDFKYHVRKPTKKHASKSGKDTIAGYPYIASVLKTGSHYASGALVDQRWVLTAAEVFYYVRESIRLFRVRLGSVDCKSGGIVLPIQQIVIHSLFKPGSPQNDLAMLRLAKPVNLAVNIQPISFFGDYGKVEAAKFQMIYWPRIIVNGQPLPAKSKTRQHHNILRVSTQKKMPFKECNHELDIRDEELTEDSFCLRPSHTNCLAHVGAPVVAHGGLWGITSGWVGACNYSYPSPVVVTRVSPPAIVYWIEAQLVTDSKDDSVKIK